MREDRKAPRRRSGLTIEPVIVSSFFFLTQEHIFGLMVYVVQYLEMRKKLVKCYVWSIAVYGAETWTLRAVAQKHMESFEMWCWRRMEKISWTDHVRNEEVLLSRGISYMK
jgi:hypothetical protein